MNYHDTNPMNRTLRNDLLYGREYMRDHSGVLALAGIAIVAAAVGGGHLAAESNKASMCEASDNTITANRGDTLWGISKQLAPDISPEVTMHQFAVVNPEISTLNYVLKEGDTLSVPICGGDLSSR